MSVALPAATTGAAAATAADLPGGTPGWEALLELEFAARGARTVLSGRRHRGPLLVQRPFHPEGEVCHVYVIHPPGGIVGGDVLKLEASVGPGAHALLTTPAAGKFYRSGAARVAHLTQTLQVAGTLEWLPQENIFYPGASVRLRTTVALGPGARFIGWEIGAFGLPARAQGFDSGDVYQGFELCCEERPLLLERLRLSPECMAARWGLAGHPAHGTLLAYPATPEQLEAARAVIGPADCADVSMSCTLLDGVLVCRALAPRADRLRQGMIDIWKRLRPMLLGRPPVLPRIWAT